MHTKAHQSMRRVAKKPAPAPEGMQKAAATGLAVRPGRPCACGGGCPRCVGAAASTAAAPLQRQSINHLPATPSGWPLRLQHKCACGASAPMGGQCDNCMGKLQAGLSAGSVDDPFEREADRVADRVMASAVPEAGGAAPVRVQRLAGSASAGQDEVPPLVQDVLGSPGQPIAQAARAFMEARFGYDFGHVRVHTDDKARDSARAMNALAYTAGRHVVFGAGQYSPGTAPGRRLLAHELAHTIQQRSTNSPMLQREPQPGADDLPCPRGEMRLAKGYPCVPYTLPGRDCPIGRVKFAGKCVPLRQQRGLLEEKLHLDPMRLPNVTAPETSPTGTTEAGSPATGATPGAEGGPPRKPCTYQVNYGAPKKVTCEKIWKDQKPDVPPPRDFCGAAAIFEITSVNASDPTCPLAGLKVSEKFAVIRDARSCSPPGYKYPDPKPCLIGAGGKLTGCTDTLSQCGKVSELLYGGCEENIKQEILVDNKTVETHTITFELDTHGSTCTGTVTRK